MILANEFNTIGFRSSGPLQVFGLNGADDICGMFFSAGTYIAFCKFSNEWKALSISGATYSCANGMNDSGIVVGQYQDATTNHGFICKDGVITSVDYPVLHSRILCQSITRM